MQCPQRPLKGASETKLLRTLVTFAFCSVEVRLQGCHLSTSLGQVLQMGWVPTPDKSERMGRQGCQEWRVFRHPGLESGGAVINSGLEPLSQMPLAYVISRGFLLCHE